MHELTLRSIINRSDRACVDVDAAVFYPRQQTSGAVEYAKQICNRCPISDDCRSFAAIHGLEGIWGGTTEAERRVAS